MKFGLPRHRSLSSRLLQIFLSLLVICLSTYLLYERGAELAFTLIAILASIILLPLVIAGWKNRRNKDKPLFEITDNKLLVKGDFGSITEYPLSGFGGIVNTRRDIFFMQYLDAPDFRDGGWKNHILISYLPMKERQLFLETLKTKLAHRLTPASTATQE